MVTDLDGQFLTQRQIPQLALVKPALTGDALILRAIGRADFQVPLMSDVSLGERRIKVWDYEGRGLDEGDGPAEWLGDFLGRPARLMRWRPEETRLSPLEVTGGVPAMNRFSDGYPLLVLSEASLDDLNARRAPRSPLPVDRFRPNVLLTGLPAYAEDGQHSLRVGEVELGLVQACTRCRITTTDQQTAIVDGKDPLQTLASYRHDSRLGGVIFGQNAIVLRGAGTRLQVGMKIELQRRAPTE